MEAERQPDVVGPRPTAGMTDVLIGIEAERRSK
jgi:hypothetical protein